MIGSRGKAEGLVRLELRECRKLYRKMNLARQDGAGPWPAVRKFELLYRHWGAMEGFGAEESHDEF